MPGSAHADHPPRSDVGAGAAANPDFRSPSARPLPSDSPGQGQGAPQVVTSPLGQTVGAPAAQSTMSHPSVPASAAGQWTTQAAPAAQLVWQGDDAQVKSHALPAPQTHWPSAHVPEQLLPGSQVT
jgi:hypothetical protein